MYLLKGMNENAKKKMNRLLNKDGETKETIKVENSNSSKAQAKPTPAKKGIEAVIAAKKGNRKATPAFSAFDLCDDDDLTPYEMQRKRQREKEEFGELSKDTMKTKKAKNERDKKEKKQHMPADQILETNVFGML